MAKSIIAREPEGKPFEQVAPGNYIARCYSMIQVGTHLSEYQGKERRRERVRITWELPTELMSEGEQKGMPFVVGEEFTLTMAEKGSLRPMLESWRGRAFTSEEAAAFDITKVLGAPCLLNVVHKPSTDGKKTYVNIASISPLPKGMECPAQVNPSLIITTDDFNDATEMAKVPKFIQKKIEESLEFKGELEQEEELPTIQTEEPDSDEVRLEDVPF